MTELHTLSRRTVLNACCGGALGVAAIGLAGCAPTGDAAGSSPDKPTGPVEVAKVADVPVGGSLDSTLNGAPILLSQPTEGTIVGFSAICTHQGCTVAAAGAEFDCPCHGSRYDAATGEVIGGPAPRPLAELTVTVKGDAVFASA